MQGTHAGSLANSGCLLTFSSSSTLLSVGKHSPLSLCDAAGHSLGGALANLAAFDIQRHCPCLKPMDVSCYTFGAPRVGNHAWAKLYDATVPDTWTLINNQVCLTLCHDRGALQRADQAE